MSRDAHLDAPALGRVLDRVLDEVDEHLPQPRRVAAQRRVDGGATSVEPDRVRLRASRGLDTDAQSAATSQSRSSSRSRPRSICARDEQLVDDLREVLGLLLDHAQEPRRWLVVELGSRGR